MKSLSGLVEQRREPARFFGSLQNDRRALRFVESSALRTRLRVETGIVPTSITLDTFQGSFMQSHPALYLRGFALLQVLVQVVLS